MNKNIHFKPLKCACDDVRCCSNRRLTVCYPLIYKWMNSNFEPISYKSHWRLHEMTVSIQTFSSVQQPTANNNEKYNNNNHDDNIIATMSVRKCVCVYDIHRISTSNIYIYCYHHPVCVPVLFKQHLGEICANDAITESRTCDWWWMDAVLCMCVRVCIVCE